MRRALAALGLAGLLVGCGPEAPPNGPVPQGDPEWQIVLDDLDRVVLSVWGSGGSDVFAVGGPLGNQGYDSLALRFDGKAWHDLGPGGDETFWWVHGTSGDDVWMVGERGRIVHRDAAGKLVEHDAGTGATLWGVLALGPADVWAVGGEPLAEEGEPTDVVLHYDGQAWAPVALPLELGKAYFKVWGTSSDDLYVVGEGATIWHKQGSSWSLESEGMGMTSNLLTVSGCHAGDVYAVGGLHVLRSAGDGQWTDLEVVLTGPVNGVSCDPSGDVIFVGGGGQKQRLVNGKWVNDLVIPPYDDLHAAWAQDDEVRWVVGGDFMSGAGAAPRRGVVARYGRGQVATTMAK